MSKEIQREHNVKGIVIEGDCGKTEDCQRCVRQTIEAFGGIDIVIGNAGWTKFSKFDDLDALTYEEWDQAFHTNVLGQHALFKEALPTFNSNAEGGVFITTSSIAGKTVFGSSMAYSVTKSAQLHLIKCLAKTQGPKVRVNAVLPGLMLTEWGRQLTEEQISGLQEQAVLKKETDIGDCADAYLSIAKNSSMTGQFIHVGRCRVVAKCKDESADSMPDSGLFVEHL